MYDSFVQESCFNDQNNNSRVYKLNKKMGYIANIKEAKLLLEDIYKNS